MYTYSNRMCKFCLVLSRILNFFNALPFTLDPQTNLYISTPKQELKFKRESFLVPLFTLFHTTHLINFIQDGRFNEIVFLYLTWICSINVTAMTFLCWYRLDDYLGFLNGTLLLGDCIARK